MEIHDNQDHPYIRTGTELRQVVDMRQWCSRVEDQRDLGSCTGAAVTGLYELLLNREHPTKYTDLSCLFVYYNARMLEGYTNSDAGAYVKNAIKAVAKFGVCSEAAWPYDTTHFADVPPVVCYQDAQCRQIKRYQKLYTIPDALDALSNDSPVVIGLTLFDQFSRITKETAVLHLPASTESATGSHAVCLVGYDLTQSRLLAKNSFGPDWGIQGYFWITTEYAVEHAFDMWTFEIDLVDPCYI